MTEREHIFRRTADSLVPLLVGLLLGVTSNYAMFAGRMASLETTASVHTREIEGLSGALREMQHTLEAILQNTNRNPRGTPP